MPRPSRLCPQHGRHGQAHERNAVDVAGVKADGQHLQFTSARSSPARNLAMASARSSVEVSPVMTAWRMPRSRSTSLIAAQCATPMAKNSNECRFSSSATSYGAGDGVAGNAAGQCGLFERPLLELAAFNRHARGVDAAGLGALRD